MHKLHYVAAAAVGFCAAIGAAAAGSLPVPQVSLTWTSSNTPSYIPGARTDDGRELALVYIGSSTCRWSNLDGLPEAVAQLKLAVQQRAAETGRSFAVVGVARDRSVIAGLRHLQKFGPFDEVMSGRGWLNIGLLKYVYQDLPGPAATPQVLVIDRAIERDNRTDVSDPVLLVRKVGAQPILDWAERSGPLPDIPAVARPDPDRPATALPQR